MKDSEIAQARVLKALATGDLSVSNRDTLGAMVPIQLFQALRLIGMGTALEEMMGTGARALVYRAGTDLGRLIGQMVAQSSGGDLNAFVAQLQDVLLKMSIGKLVIEKVNLPEGHITLRVDECVSCAGVTGASEPICQFEGGLVAGVLSEFLDKRVKATETRCNACGDGTCGFEVEISDKTY